MEYYATIRASQCTVPVLHQADRLCGGPTHFVITVVPWQLPICVDGPALRYAATFSRNPRSHPARQPESRAARSSPPLAHSAEGQEQQQRHQGNQPARTASKGRSRTLVHRILEGTGSTGRNWPKPRPVSRGLRESCRGARRQACDRKRDRVIEGSVRGRDGNDEISCVTGIDGLPARRAADGEARSLHDQRHARIDRGIVDLYRSV